MHDSWLLETALRIHSSIRVLHAADVKNTHINTDTRYVLRRSYGSDIPGISFLRSGAVYLSTFHCCFTFFPFFSVLPVVRCWKIQRSKQIVLSSPSITSRIPYQDITHTRLETLRIFAREGLLIGETIRTSFAPKDHRAELYLLHRWLRRCCLETVFKLRAPPDVMDRQCGESKLYYSCESKPAVKKV